MVRHNIIYIIIIIIYRYTEDILSPPKLSRVFYLYFYFFHIRFLINVPRYKIIVIDDAH